MTGDVRAPMRLALAAALVVGALVAACSSDNGTAASSSDTAVASDTAAATDTGSQPLQILVTNDDGVGSEGIDVLVNQLQTLPDVKVTVVAPADQRSGTGSKSTEGALTTRDAKTAGGYPAVAVDGFPADTIRAAVDDLGVKPDLVVAGINQGQNVGPAVNVSGTIGAARAAAQRGIPAVAVSQGRGAANQPLDYQAGAKLVLDWIDQNRDRLEVTPGTPQPSVVNFNAPSCSVGEIRDLAMVPAATGADVGGALGATDQCTAPLSGPPTDDVEALTHGYATESEVPVQPG